jgi:hypothetical protein
MINGKMDPEKKAKWVAALRSGEYKQGQFQLCTSPDSELHPGGDGPVYCCLGVANKIFGLGCSDDDVHLFAYLGFGCTEPILLDQMTQNKLVRFNDDEGWDFNAIASWIEANL